jgi:hypothetical protein
MVGNNTDDVVIEKSGRPRVWVVLPLSNYWLSSNILIFNFCFQSAWPLSASKIVRRASVGLDSSQSREGRTDSNDVGVEAFSIWEIEVSWLDSQRSNVSRHQVAMIP